MNTIRTVVFLVALSLSCGCASVAPADSKCPDATLKKITIVYQRHNKITVAPSVRRVDPGDAIEYNVTGPASRNRQPAGPITGRMPIIPGIPLISGIMVTVP